jgi:hypothetical protein
MKLSSWDTYQGVQYKTSASTKKLQNDYVKLLYMAI